MSGAEVSGALRGDGPAHKRTAARMSIMGAESVKRRSRNKVKQVSEPVARRRPRRHLCSAILLALVCVGVYANSAGNPFQLDDYPLIVEDPRVRDGAITELLTGDYWYTDSPTVQYRPLANLSYALSWALSPSPAAFRWPNLVLHFGVCLVLFYLGLELFGSFVVGLVSALLFAVHPLHTEVLNLGVGRAELLASLGVLLPALLYWRDADPETSSSRWRPVWAGACFALGLGCKENAITLVGVVVLLDLWRWKGGAYLNARWWRRRLLRAYAPMIGIIAAFLLIRAAFVGASFHSDAGLDLHVDNPIATPERGLEPGESAFLARWGTPVVTLGKSAQMLFWPTRLCCDYSYAALDTVRRLYDPRLWRAGGVVGLVLLIVLLSMRARGKLALCAGLSLVTYSVVSNFIVLSGTVFGERLLYLPSAGACLAVGLLAEWAGKKVRTEGTLRKVTAATVLLLVAAATVWYAGASVARNRDWRSHGALWSSAEQVNPDSVRVLVNRAATEAEQGDDSASLAYALRATELVPDLWRGWRAAGAAHQRTGQLDSALRCYEEAWERGAYLDEVVVLGLSELLIYRGEVSRAIEVVRRAIAGRRSRWGRGRFRLAELLILDDHTEEAVSLLEVLVREYPDWNAPRDKLAQCVAPGS
ncbi:MAG: DUF1736 domain-containing protein [bacterium]|nr:DUF1736 domain-containing protein [bacterium]